MKRSLKYYIIALSVLINCGLSAYAGEARSSATDNSSAKLMLVPDSLVNEVEDLIIGRLKTVRDNSKVDPSEMVIVGNDTLPLIIKQRNFGRYERGLFNYLFIPKGSWQIGATVSYGDFSTDDLKLLNLITDCDVSGHIFSIKPYLQYFIKSNFAVGVRLGYTNADAKIGSFNLDLDDDMSLSLSDIGYRSEAYTAAILTRNYVGLARAGRFGLFNEVELAFSSGNSNFKRPVSGNIKDTRTTYMEAQLNFSPGLTVMMMKNASFNVSFGVFGFHIKSEKQSVDGEPMGRRLTSGANFRFNIFNINFGMGIHF